MAWFMKHSYTMTGLIMHTAGVALSLSTVITIAGCHSTYSAMPSGRSMPVYAAAAAAADAVAFETVLVPTQLVDEDPIDIAVHIARNDEADHRLVFFHGVLSNHECWRYIIGDLARDHELYLVDLPGCGDSDHPDPDAVTPPVYTLDNVADRMLLTLRALPGFLNDERDVTLIGHSYGATLALHMLGGDAFIERYEDVHERIASAFLLAPADFDVYVPNPLMVRVSTVSDFEVWLADITGTLRETIARRERQAMADPHKAMREEVDARYDIIRNRAMRRATQALLRDIASLDDDLLPDWDRIEGLVAGYANVRVPVLIVFGARDEVLPPAMGFKIAAYVPYADVKIVPYCKHSVHVEYPEHCAELIRTYCHAGHVEGVADPDIPAHVRRTSPEDRRHSAHR